MQTEAKRRTTHTPENVARRFATAYRSRHFFDPIARRWFEWSDRGWRDIEAALLFERIRGVVVYVASTVSEAERHEMLTPWFIGRVEVYARDRHYSTAIARRRVKSNRQV
jgi:hypothetical protein